MIAILRGDLRQGGRDIELGDRARGSPNALCLSGRALADVGEEFALERQNFLLASSTLRS
ncbi:MAG: hypothetical protein WDO73_13230 [Ignavibacteriota bacterium]